MMELHVFISTRYWEIIEQSNDFRPFSHSFVFIIVVFSSSLELLPSCLSAARAWGTCLARVVVDEQWSTEGLEPSGEKTAPQKNLLAHFMGLSTIKTTREPLGICKHFRMELFLFCSCAARVKYQLNPEHVLVKASSRHCRNNNRENWIPSSEVFVRLELFEEILLSFCILSV